MIAPTLLDRARTSSIFTVPIPRWESWITRPGSLSTPPWQLMGLSARRSVVSSAAESVITLKTEPGSNGTDAAWFCRAARSASDRGGRLGS